MPLSDLETIKRSLPAANAATSGVLAYKREYPPAHYDLKIAGFSLLCETKDGEKYDSKIFEAEGYKWSLSLYPKGDTKHNGGGYVSLYLAIQETEKLPHGWEVNANFRLFVLDQMKNVYLIVQDENGGVRRFHELKKEWGFPQLISLDQFNEGSNGYLVDDACVFGAEVFVLKPSWMWESLTMTMAPPNNKHAWTLHDFSKMDQNYYYSDFFKVGETTWKLQVNPTGHGTGSGKFLSLFLELVAPKSKTYAEYELRVLNQLNNNHHEAKINRWFTSESSWGRDEFLSLEDLHNPGKGFTVDDTVKVEVEIFIMSDLKDSSGGV